MKSKCYNTVVKVIRESEDVTAICTCPAGSIAKFLERWNLVGAILFAFALNRKKLLKNY